VHRHERSSATIHRFANVLGSILKQYNSTPASRIRPQIFNTYEHFLQGRISLGNPTIFSSKI
jgi:hypothetical protein